MLFPNKVTSSVCEPTCQSTTAGDTTDEVRKCSKKYTWWGNAGRRVGALCVEEERDKHIRCDARFAKNNLISMLCDKPREWKRKAYLTYGTTQGWFLVLTCVSFGWMTEHASRKTLSAAIEEHQPNRCETAGGKRKAELRMKLSSYSGYNYDWHMCMYYIGDLQLTSPQRKEDAATHALASPSHGDTIGWRYFCFSPDGALQCLLKPS